jgi:hypothetical protein
MLSLRYISSPAPIASVLAYIEELKLKEMREPDYVACLLCARICIQAFLISHLVLCTGNDRLFLWNSGKISNWPNITQFFPTAEPGGGFLALECMHFSLLRAAFMAIDLAMFYYRFLEKTCSSNYYAQEISITCFSPGPAGEGY